MQRLVSDLIQAPHRTQKVPKAHSSPRPPGPAFVSFAQQRIRSTLRQYDSDIQQNTNAGFSKPCTLQTKMISLVPQQVVARRSAQSLHYCSCGVNPSN